MSMFTKEDLLKRREERKAKDAELSKMIKEYHKNKASNLEESSTNSSAGISSLFAKLNETNARLDEVEGNLTEVRGNLVTVNTTASEAQQLAIENTDNLVTVNTTASEAQQLAIENTDNLVTVNTTASEAQQLAIENKGNLVTVNTTASEAQEQGIKNKDDLIKVNATASEAQQLAIENKGNLTKVNETASKALKQANDNNEIIGELNNDVSHCTNPLEEFLTGHLQRKNVYSTLEDVYKIMSTNDKNAPAAAEEGCVNGGIVVHKASNGKHDSTTKYDPLLCMDKDEFKLGSHQISGQYDDGEDYTAILNLSEVRDTLGAVQYYAIDEA